MVTASVMNVDPLAADDEALRRTGGKEPEGRVERHVAQGAETVAQGAGPDPLPDPDSEPDSEPDSDPQSGLDD